MSMCVWVFALYTVYSHKRVQSARRNGFEEGGAAGGEKIV